MVSNDRRMFLQTAGATLALPLVGGELAFAQQRRGCDPVLAELLRQTKAAAQKASKASATAGESARQVANVLRLLAAHGATIGLEASISRALRETVARDGRHAVLARRVDAKTLAADLGIDIDPARLGFVAVDEAKRAAALDSVLKNGFGQAWVAVAQSLDDIAAQLDAQRGVQLVKQPSSADCGMGQFALIWLEFAMVAACGPWAGPVWLESCGIASAAYVTYRLSLYFMGCL